MNRFFIAILFLFCASLNAEVDVIAAGEVKLIEIQDGKKITHIDLYTWWEGEGNINQYFYCSDCDFQTGKVYLVYLEFDSNNKLYLVEGLNLEEGFRRFEELGEPYRRYVLDVGLGGLYLGFHDGLYATWVGWFGIILDSQNDGFNYIYHFEHGWFVRAPEPAQRGDSDGWFWDFSKEDWLYTGAGIYPFMFSAEEWDWLYYFEGGTPDQRWFYSFKNEAFESVVSE